MMAAEGQEPMVLDEGGPISLLSSSLARIAGYTLHESMGFLGFVAEKIGQPVRPPPRLHNVRRIEDGVAGEAEGEHPQGGQGAVPGDRFDRVRRAFELPVPLFAVLVILTVGLLTGALFGFYIGGDNVFSVQVITDSHLSREFADPGNHVPWYLPASMTRRKDTLALEEKTMEQLSTSSGRSRIFIAHLNMTLPWFHNAAAASSSVATVQVATPASSEAQASSFFGSTGKKVASEKFSGGDDGTSSSGGGKKGNWLREKFRALDSRMTNSGEWADEFFNGAWV